MEHPKEMKQARLFVGNDLSDEEKGRISHEIGKLGGLTFKLFCDDDGWTAQCNEVSGIIASGDNPKASSDEIESEIRAAVLATFGARERMHSPYFEYTVARGV